MKVKELIKLLELFNPEAEVMLPGPGYETEAGTWLDGNPEELSHLTPDPEGPFAESALEVHLNS